MTEIIQDDDLTDNLSENKWALNLLNHPNPKLRAEAAYVISKEVLLSNNNDEDKKLKIINKFLNDISDTVSDKTFLAIGESYTELKNIQLKTKLEELVLSASERRSINVKNGRLLIAIQIAKEFAEKRDYKKASDSLKQSLNDPRYKLLDLTQNIAKLRLFVDVLFFCSVNFSFILTFFIFPTFLFFGLLIYHLIPLSQFTQIRFFSLIIVLLLGNYLFLKYFVNTEKLKYPKIQFFKPFKTVPLIFSIFLVYFSMLIIIATLSSTHPGLLLYFFPDLLICTLFYVLSLFGAYFSTFLNSKYLHLAVLSNGLLNYFKGRYYISFYLKSNNSFDELKYLEIAIDSFQKSNKNYENLFINLGNELSLCPYCLNFYQGIQVYEKTLREPEDPKIGKMRQNLINAAIIMNKTGKGSERLNNIMDELFKAATLIVELKKKRLKFTESDSIDRTRIDNEIRKQSEEINLIIKKMDVIIAEIEDADLPIVIDIIKYKKNELGLISKEVSDSGVNGVKKYFSRKKLNIAGIILFIFSIILLIMGGIYSSDYLATGIIFTITGTIILYFIKIKTEA